MQLSTCAQGVSRFLDRAEAADRVAIRAHAQQAQYDEYDDEYDDSFDDLGGPSADGIADVEGRNLSMPSLPPALGCAHTSSMHKGPYSLPLHKISSHTCMGGVQAGLESSAQDRDCLDSLQGMMRSGPRA